MAVFPISRGKMISLMVNWHLAVPRKPPQHVQVATRAAFTTSDNVHLVGEIDRLISDACHNRCIIRSDECERSSQRDTCRVVPIDENGERLMAQLLRCRDGPSHSLRHNPPH